jgi:hypothetical protein
VLDAGTSHRRGIDLARELLVQPMRTSEAGMDDERFDPDALADAMAAMLGLQVTPAQRPGVLLHLRNTRRIAAPMLRFPLPERSENAPVFRS